MDGHQGEGRWVGAGVHNDLEHQGSRGGITRVTWSVMAFCPLPSSHNLALLSLLPVANCRPSGLKATLLTSVYPDPPPPSTLTTYGRSGCRVVRGSSAGQCSKDWGGGGGGTGIACRREAVRGSQPRVYIQHRLHHRKTLKERGGTDRGEAQGMGEGGRGDGGGERGRGGSRGGEAERGEPGGRRVGREGGFRGAS